MDCIVYTIPQYIVIFRIVKLLTFSKQRFAESSAPELVYSLILNVNNSPSNICINNREKYRIFCIMYLIFGCNRNCIIYINCRANCMRRIQVFTMRIIDCLLVVLQGTKTPYFIVRSTEEHIHTRKPFVLLIASVFFHLLDNTYVASFL